MGCWPAAELKLKSAHSDDIHFVIWTNAFHNLQKNIETSEEIHLAILTDTFGNFDRYVWQFGQIQLIMRKNTVTILSNAISDLEKHILQFGRTHFPTLQRAARELKLKSAQSAEISASSVSQLDSPAWFPIWS